MHKAEHNIDAKWHFFATSHGKNSCDGIGGYIKRAVRRASLQRPYRDQILNLEAMHTFCIGKMTTIKFVLFNRTDMEAYRLACESSGRYAKAKSIPGTRSFHCFTPLKEMSLACRRTSTCSKSVNFSFKGKANDPPPVCVPTDELAVNKYVLCSYDEFHYVGIIQDCDKDYEDCEVRFMFPKYRPNASYSWPRREDVVYVPNKKILALVDIVTQTGRQYQITEDCEKILANII